jgi:hypothetical protein
MTDAGVPGETYFGSDIRERTDPAALEGLAIASRTG